MGEDHGRQTPQNVDLVSNLSPGRSIRASTETTEITLMNGSVRRYWKAACIERCTCSLGEGSQKSALVREQLAGFLSYAETLFSIQRRLADHGFSNARTWLEMLYEHKKWWTNYNIEHHFAHRARQDGRHSPLEVLRGVLGRTYPEEVLSRILYATQFTRHLDKHGYVKFRNWRFFGEDGLAGEEVSVWVYEGTLKIEYQATALSLYSITFQPDHKHILDVKNPRRIETHFRSPQLDLWQISDTEWLLALRRPEQGKRRKRRKPVALAHQLPFPEFGATG
jgi:hypothetical protein